MIKTLVVIIAVAVVFIVFIRYFESKSYFHPTREMPTTPADVGLNFEDIYLTSEDGVKINGWFIRHPQAKSTFLYFHGNAGNMTHRLEKIQMFHKLGLNIFIIDYRGYGKSEGQPTEKGVYRDARAAYDYLLSRKDIDLKKIIAYGDSLGGVVAVDLAIQRSVACLIVDSSFSSGADIAKDIFPFVPSMILTTKMDSKKKVKAITIPKLFIHSVNDEIIPFYLGERLFQAASEPKQFLKITGGHNTSHIDSQDIYQSGFRKFLQAQGLI